VLFGIALGTLVAYLLLGGVRREGPRCQSGLPFAVG
jgi:hypothetical protein